MTQYVLFSHMVSLFLLCHPDMIAHWLICPFLFNVLASSAELSKMYIPTDYHHSKISFEAGNWIPFNMWYTNHESVELLESCPTKQMSKSFITHTLKINIIMRACKPILNMWKFAHTNIDLAFRFISSGYDPDHSSGCINAVTIV